MLVVDARADRIDRGQIVAPHGFDAEQHLAAVRVEAVPGIAEAAGHLAVLGDRAGRTGRRGRSGGIAGQLRIGQFGRQLQIGARRRAPLRLARHLAGQFVVVGEIADAIAVAPQEQPGRGGPMAGQEGRLIDHGVADAALRQDRARLLAAPARIEIVAMEIEHHDPGPLDLLQERVEPARVEFPAVIEIIEAAIGRRRGGDDPVDIGRAVRRHQRQEGAEGLAGQHDLLVAVLLQAGGKVDEALGAVAQRVAMAHPVEPHDVPAILAQRGQIGGGRRFRIFGVDRAAVAPDDGALGLGRAERRRLERRVEPDCEGRSGSQEPDRQSRGTEPSRQQMPHSRVTPLLFSIRVTR